MDGVHPPLLCQPDDAVNIQISPQRALFLADQVALVRLGAEQGKGVLLGVDGQRAEIQIVAGAKNADGDFTPVGCHDLVKRAC